MVTSMDVLIVDDEPEIRELLCEYLRLKGYTVVEASSGRKAIETLLLFKPGIFILDIMMPDMDGFELLRIIRNNPEHSNTPVVFFSGSTKARDIFHSNPPEHTEFLMKPAELFVLGDTVDKFMNV